MREIVVLKRNRDITNGKSDDSFFSTINSAFLMTLCAAMRRGSSRITEILCGQPERIAENPAYGSEEIAGALVLATQIVKSLHIRYRVTVSDVPFMAGTHSTWKMLSRSGGFSMESKSPMSKFGDNPTLGQSRYPALR